MGSCASQKFTSSSKKAGRKKKVHVRGTIARKPLSFVKNGSGILFRGYLGLFNENEMFIIYSSTSCRKSLFCDTQDSKFSPQGIFWKTCRPHLIAKNQVCRKTCFLKHINKLIESHGQIFQSDLSLVF